MKTKRIFWSVLLLVLLFSACSPGSSGPSAWIDQPLDGSVFPLQPIPLTAHASDSDGVASFEIFLGDELLQSIPAGGERLEEAAWEWLPPGAGEFTLSVKAIDSEGNSGPETEVDLTITGPSEVQIVSATPTVEPAAPVPDVSNQVTATADSACRQGPDPAFAVSGYILLDQSAAARGKLADNSWIQVEFPGADYVCWITANLLDIEPSYLETLPDVVSPPLPAPTFTATTEPDTLAPIISGPNSSPDLILTEGSGCSSYSRTTTVAATITDDVAVSSASALWSIGGESGSITLTPSGGGIYQGNIGPVNTVGSLQITIQAWDSTGNSSSASAPSVTVQNCIE